MSRGSDRYDAYGFDVPVVGVVFNQETGGENWVNTPYCELQLG